MCTCISLKVKDHYFGRNLDLEYSFNQKVVVTPRNYAFKLKNGQELKTQYAIIGMANVAGDYPLYAEATNEQGLSMAGLYFPGNARFFSSQSDRLNLAPYELIPYFLASFSRVEEVKDCLLNLNITDLAFSPELPITDLHWMISDREQSLVIEQMESGIKVYPNPTGVLTNNPPFDYQLTNLNNYLNLSTGRGVNRFSDRLNLEAYGQGMGAIGLPGDNSPASRFVRAAFNSLNSSCDGDEDCAVGQFFHILDSVAMVKGATVTPEGKDDFTIYSSCANTDRGIYYYKTYKNNQINAVRLDQENKHSSTLSVYELQEKQQINYQN